VTVLVAAGVAISAAGVAALLALIAWWVVSDRRASLPHRHDQHRGG
jgi:phosphotransferase system  glucose/maltose/N-acetylglucosamine-specific IIC component